MPPKSSRKIRKNEIAFSLLEVLIALSIASVLWGSTVFFMTSLQKKMQKVMRSYKTEELRAIHLKFQSDIHSAVKITRLTPDHLSIELAEGKVIYEYSNSTIYRQFKNIETNAFHDILANRWDCLSPKDKNLNACTVVLWNYDFNGESESIYAVKKQA